jgi:hypothetical protein
LLCRNKNTSSYIYKPRWRVIRCIFMENELKIGIHPHIRGIYSDRLEHAVA